nr:M56 family metallopeptidase [uncultured Oscillibacter sp.]
MSDIWSFLLQTLTASGAAAVLLAVKAMLRDKLSPRWQFAVWGVLALVLLVPAGLGGRYALVNWPLAVEFLRSLLTEEFSALAHVSAPVPLPRFTGLPRSGAEWAYVVYLAGAALLLGRYAVSYLRLRLALRRGTPAGADRTALIRETAARYGLPSCPAVEVEGLHSAFICGVFRPVLALPAGEETDEKVILHELLHLKHRDAAWGLLICLLRCLHWCNPLLWHCADLAGNDLESLCDQRVLERLEGENRRDYGRILLSMANEKYARAPGTSSMANGGRNIRRRVEAIARFKRYPAGMALASVCAALVLAGPCLIGTRAQGVYTGGGLLPQRLRPYAAMASARTTCCTTYAGAFDTYAKAVLAENPVYLAMCAPLEDQDRLWISARLRRASRLESWDSVRMPRLESFTVDWQSGYRIYNLRPVEDGAYEGLLVLEPDTVAPWVEKELPPWDGTVHSRYLAIQPLRAEKQGDRWVVLPLGDFQVVQGDERDTGNLGLPAWVYEARCGDFTLRMRYQTNSWVEESYVTRFHLFSTKPQPDGEFSSSYYGTDLTAIYNGTPADRASIRSVGVSCAPWPFEDRRPELQRGMGNSSGSSSTGCIWDFRDNFDWELHGDEIPLGGGGGGGSGGTESWVYPPPDRYAADFYLNGEKAGELTLLPVEGGLP